MVSLTRMRLAMVLVAAAVLAVAVAACAGAAGQATATPLGPPTPTAPPTPTPTATPTPRPTPGPPASQLAAIAVLRDAPAGTVQTAYAGTLIEFRLAGLAPLERLVVTETPPQGLPREAGYVRADSQGVAVWKKDTLEMAKGAWQLRVAGEFGASRTIAYTVISLALPAGNGAREGGFTVYRTTEAAFFFTDDVDAASVVLAAQHYRDAMPEVLKDFSFTLEAPVDFYMVKGSEALLREIQTGGAEQITGLEQGISLVGFPRSGVYLDMAVPAAVLAHLVVHEATHQVTSRIDDRRQAPVWLLEGLSEYEAVKLGVPPSPDAERWWRRERRDVVRQAIEQQGWIDLRDFSDLSQLQGNETEAWLDVGYAESYVAADYVAQVYGEQALRPLLEQLSLRSDEQDAVFTLLFGVTFDRFQEQVRAWVQELAPDEAEAQALKTFSGELVRLVDGAEELSREWNSYVAGRANLSAQQRAARLAALVQANDALGVRARGLATPAAGEESRAIYVDGVESFARAIEAFGRYEQTRRRSDLDAGNAALRDAAHAVRATLDRLAFALASVGLPRELAFGEKAAAG